jgi:hypothetical protein
MSFPLGGGGLGGSGMLILSPASVGGDKCGEDPLTGSPLGGVMFFDGSKVCASKT